MNPANRLIATATGIMLSAAMAAAGQDSRADFNTGLLRGGEEARSIKVDISGVRDLYLAVTYGGDTYNYDQAIWAEPFLIDKAGAKVDLTKLKPVDSQVGWGRLLVNNNHTNQGLSIAGRKFKRGFWAHGPSLLHFKLDGDYVRFEAYAGIDSTAGTNGSAEFIVCDKRPVMPSPSEYGVSPPKPSLPAPPPAGESPHTLNSEAAKILIGNGVDQLVFIRRYTLNANHVYTEYVNSTWTPGGGLCILDLRTGEVRELARELGDGVFNRFDISFDASKIVFDFKKGPNDGYRIYEIGIDGSGLRQLTFEQEDEAELVSRYGGGYHHGTDDLHPCYLPDGGIVFATTRCQYGVLCDVSDTFTTKNLYRMNADGSNMTTLSNSPLSEATPVMLEDGRILYHRWEYVDKAAGNVKALWAMNPDGTTSAEIYGNTISFPETMIYARPIPGAEGKIVMLGASHCCPNNAMGAVIVINTSDELRSAATMRFVTNDIHALAHNGFHFRDENGEWKIDMTGRGGRLFKDPYPISEELFIASRKPKGPAWDAPKAYDLVLLDGDGNERPLYRDESISCWHAYPLRRRVRPAQLALSRDEELAGKGLALCVVADIYKGMECVERGTIKYLRILEEVPRPWAARKAWFADDNDGMAHSAIGDDLLGVKVQYGVVPVEADGSACFYVPAMRNIYFQALDENCLAVQTERTYVHYMPGETRGCIGCHETPNYAPKGPGARTVQAMKHSPAFPSAQPGEKAARKLFDYDRQIQPVWDRHCLQCHSSDKAEGGLNLAGEPEWVYSISYNNLIRLSKSDKQLLGCRSPRNEDAASAGIEYLGPYVLGALSSPLAGMLSQGRIEMRDARLRTYTAKLIESHKDIQVSKAELLEVTNWLDVNCQFHRSYWGRLNAKYAGHANYRPDVTFDEALERSVPESVARAEAAGEKSVAVRP